MRKLVLGKGLRALLNGTPVPGEPEESLPRPLAQPGPNPGLNTLLQGERKVSPSPENEASPAPTPLTRFCQKWTFVKWVLFSADLLLISLASLVVFQKSRPLSFWEWTLCVLGLTIGAVLAFLALLGKSNPEPNSSVTPK